MDSHVLLQAPERDKKDLNLKYSSSPLSHTFHNVKLVLQKIKKETKSDSLVI